MNSVEKSKILVLGDTLSALAVGRSLGRKGISVIAGIEDSRAPLGYSRYTSKIFDLPSYASEPDKWIESIKKVLFEERPDLVIPVSESSFVPFCINRDYFAGLVQAAIPDKDGFENTFFKDKTVAIARELGIPIPESFVVWNKEDLEKFFNVSSFDSPFVLKPVVSKVWQDGYKLEFPAKKADSLEEVKKYVNDYLPFASILVQKWVPGIGVGQEFLCKDGEILLAFQHERIHEPQGSGGSSYRKSVPLDERMMAHSKKLLKYLKWTGVAMVEYRKNLETGDFVLLEINGRFWGSLSLAVEAGADFPHALYRMMMYDEKSFSRDYNIGVYARDLMDDLRFIAKSRGMITAFLNLGLAKAKFLLGMEKWDAFTWDDLMPGLAEFWFVARSVFSSAVERLYKILYVISHRQPRPENIKKLLKKNRSILFVCLGNVSRSPFAAEYFKKKLREKNISGVKISSAGLYPKGGRQATPYVKLAAVEYGADLTFHRSSVLSKKAVDSSGLILCMDFRGYRNIKKKFPSARTKLFLLGSFNGSYREIEDPQGRDLQIYKLTCRIISENIKKIASLWEE